MLGLHAPTKFLCLTMPATPPPGGLEQVASLLAHQAARGDTSRAKQLLDSHLQAHAHQGRRARATRGEAGRLARATPVPEVVLMVLRLLDDHAEVTQDAFRELLRVAGLSDGQAGRALVMGLSELYGLLKPCSPAALSEILAVQPALRTTGVIKNETAWSRPQQRELKRRGSSRRTAGWSAATT